MKRIVMLVDSKVRDLDLATLLAHHIASRGVTCILEPLEAYRGIIAGRRPALVLSNHLTAGHLAAWSKRLAELGIMTAVLPNEGIFYDEDDLRFSAGRFHNAHVDHFFCWNEAHRQALLDEKRDSGTAVALVGVPRFDFYFEPWAGIVREQAKWPATRPKVLLCTNFIAAHFHDLPPEEGDRFFNLWAKRLPLYHDYRGAIDAHWRSRTKLLDYLNALIARDRYDIVLRPHPREDPVFYQNWARGLTAEQRRFVRVDSTSNISGLILNADVELSCETCTTAMESWIARKPTIELMFERHPLWYREEQGRANQPCDDPQRLPAMVDAALADPEQSAFRAVRDEHLATWCGPVDGRASERVAAVIAEAVNAAPEPEWSKLTFSDHRRGYKLRSLTRLGQAYHFDPLLPVKRRIWPDRYTVKTKIYEKSIKPADVDRAVRRLHQGMAR